MMLRLIAFCLVIVFPLAWAQCKKSQSSFCTDDGQVKWKAYNDDKYRKGVFYPSRDPIIFDCDDNIVLIETTTRKSQVKVLKVNVEVRWVISLQIGKKKITIPKSQRGHYTIQSFAFKQKDKINNVVKIIVERMNTEASMRSIYISGCYESNAVTVNENLDELRGLWQANTSFYDVADIYYTPNARFYEPGQPERIGPKEIADFIFLPIQEVRPKVFVSVDDAIRLSETRIYSLHTAVFYDADGNPDPVRRYASIWLYDCKSGKWKRDRVTVNYEKPNQNFNRPCEAP